MNGIQAVKVRRVVAAVAIGAIAWCASVKAQVLDQVPSDAIVVLKINNLQGVSDKVAKMAKDFGVDEFQPQFKNPLGALMEHGHVSKGLNKSGDLVVCGFDSGDKKGEALVLVPVDNFKDFVSNFEAAGPANAQIIEVKPPQGDGPNLFIAERGKFAAMSPDKELVQKKATGIKLPAASAKDAQGRDAVVFINIPGVRDKGLSEIRKNRQNAIDELTKNMESDANAKPFASVAKVVAGEAFDFAERFLSDCQGVVFSLNLNDQGISLGGLSEFTADSRIGKTVSQLKNTSTPLLAGLPDRKYYAFGGMAWDPKVLSGIMTDCIDPINAELKKSGDTGKQIATLLESAKTLAGSMNRVAAGYPMAQGAIGNEAIIQQISVVNGDAKAIASAERSLFLGLGQLMALAPKEAGTMKLDVTEGAKTVDGVKLDSYAMSINPDPNNPQAAQMQQMMAMIYGPTGMGGLMGVVDDKTFIAFQGANDKLISEAIAAAKSQKDVLSSSKGVQSVSAQLPKQRSFEQYIALDNIVSAGVRYAQGFGLQVKMKLPQDLPPIGVAAGTEGPVVRGEVFIPSQTVQSLISAGLQAYQQMQGGGNGGL
jgi:hypothetical protein